MKQKHEFSLKKESERQYIEFLKSKYTSDNHGLTNNTQNNPFENHKGSSQKHVTSSCYNTCGVVKE